MDKFRLTEKDDNYEAFLARQKKDPDLMMWGDAELYGKCQEIENIEDELGIDLVTFYTMLKKGIWVNRASFRYEYPRDIELSLEYDEKTFWVKDYEYKFKDYGKSWALTREELE